MATPTLASAAAARPALPAGRCGGCGSRHRASPASGSCPRCTSQVRRQAARHVAAHPGRRPFGPARWST